jgi:hypothetical protein
MNGVEIVTSELPPLSPDLVFRLIRWLARADSPGDGDFKGSRPSARRS